MTLMGGSGVQLLPVQIFASGMCMGQGGEGGSVEVLEGHSPEREKIIYP